MWICLNNAFVSIVSPENQENGMLLVRARRPGDLETAFPGCHVQRSPGRDYLFRTLLPREVVGRCIAAAVNAIDYPNFKNSVGNQALHDAYSKTWYTMSALQTVRPYARDTAIAREAEALFLVKEGREGLIQGESAA